MPDDIPSQTPAQYESAKLAHAEHLAKLEAERKAMSRKKPRRKRLHSQTR